MKWLWLSFCALGFTAIRLNGEETNTLASARMDLQFAQSAPYSTVRQIARHLGFAGDAPAYDLTHERFLGVVPDQYTTNGAWGLLVWISASNNPRVPAAWEAKLAEHKLLFIGAYDSGNNRPPIDRCRLALDAVCNMARRFPIDSKRVYVGGFSGGARMASILGVAYGDLFTGALCVCGVDFYQSVPAGSGGYYPVSYRPDAGIVLLARQRGRFVLLTGEKDMNRDNTKSTADFGFKRSGFQNVLYLEVPGMAHLMPQAEVLDSALAFLGKKTER